MKRQIGNKYIRLGQGFNIFLFFLWLLFSVLLWLINKSPNGIYVLITGGIIWSIISLLYLQVFEVAIDENKIFLQNLFLKTTVEKSDFKKIEKTILSPFIFKITFTVSKSRFFMVRNDTFLKGVFSFDSNYTTKALNKTINGNN